MIEWLIMLFIMEILNIEKTALRRQQAAFGQSFVKVVHFEM
jgi:hypothetical protein